MQQLIYSYATYMYSHKKIVNNEKKGEKNYSRTNIRINMIMKKFPKGVAQVFSQLREGEILFSFNIGRRKKHFLLILCFK